MLKKFSRAKRLGAVTQRWSTLSRAEFSEPLTRSLRRRQTSIKREIKTANANLNAIAKLVAQMGVDPNFFAGLQSARLQIGGDIDFANQEHRETLGKAIISAVRASETVCSVSVGVRSC